MKYSVIGEYCLCCDQQAANVGADDKSRVLDIDNPDPDLFPDFHRAVRYECMLQPGDVLFIPGSHTCIEPVVCVRRRLQIFKQACPCIGYGYVNCPYTFL